MYTTSEEALAGGRLALTRPIRLQDYSIMEPLDCAHVVLSALRLCLTTVPQSRRPNARSKAHVQARDITSIYSAVGHPAYIKSLQNTSAVARRVR